MTIRSLVVVHLIIDAPTYMTITAVTAITQLPLGSMVSYLRIDGL